MVDSTRSKFGESDDPDLRHISGFEILEVIAEGGSAIVYRARQIHPAREVALKVLRGADRHDRARFAIECELAARLNHPNIVTLYEAGEWNGSPWIALALVRGRDLARRIADGDMSRHEMLRCLEDVCSAVHFAHQRGVLHRDLKPANVLIDESGRARVADFGLARDLERRAELTRTGEALGTPAYMSPEQVRGRAQEISFATDVYGLGAILYQVLTGRPPFVATGSFALMQRVLFELPVAPRRIDPSIDADLECITLKCLLKDPRDRYLSAAEVAADLARHRTHHPVMARAIPWWRRTLLSARRHPVASVALVAGIAITLSAVASWFLVATEQATRAATEARSIRDRSFTGLMTAISEYRHFEVGGSLAAFDFGEGAERASKLIELATVLRRQRAHGIAREFAQRSRAAALEGSEADAVERAIEIEVLALADMGDFAEAFRVASSGRSPRTRFLARMLETLAPGLREVGTIGSFAVGSELCAIDCGDVDGDGAAELMLAYSAGEKDLLRPRIRVELTSFAKGMRRSEIRLPEAPEVFHLQLVDINGDGRSEILRYRRGASRETIAEAYSVSSAGQASDRPVFCDTFIDGDPVVIVAAELDENPGNELVVFCAPNRRETLWYTASEAGAYPDARTRRTFDPLLESTETDVAVAHVIGDSRTPGSPLLVVGTTGHSLFEIRSYSVSHGAVALRGSLPRGRVMGICGGPDGSVLYSVSTTRLDPKLPRELDRDWIARNAIGGVRMVADGSFHWLDDVVIPRSPFQENLATDWCELRGLAAWSKPAPGSQIFGATAIGFAACSRFDTVPTTNLALCDLATGEAAALAIPTLMKIGDLDGDGDAEVVAISGQKVLVAGLAQCDVPRVGSWPEIESQFEMRRWLALLRGCVEGTPDRSEYERMGGPWQAGIETRVDAEFTTGRCRSAKERDFGMELGAVPIECPPKCLSGKARQIEIREDRHVAEYIALTPSDAAGDGFTYEAEFSLPEMEYGSVVRFGLFDQAGPRVALKFSHHRIPTVRPGSRHALQVDVPPNSVVCNRVATDRPFEEDLWYRLSIRGRISDGVSIVELRALDHPRDEAPEVQAVVELPAIQRGELRAGFEGWNENPAAGGRARLLLRRLAVSQWELP